MNNMKRDDFREKAHSVLDEIMDNIAEMEKKAGSISEDVKHEYDKKLARLKEIQKDLSTKLDDYETITEGRWDVVKDSFGDFMDKVYEAWKESYHKAKSSFK